MWLYFLFVLSTVRSFAYIYVFVYTCKDIACVLQTWPVLCSTLNLSSFYSKLFSEKKNQKHLTFFVCVCARVRAVCVCVCVLAPYIVLFSALEHTAALLTHAIQTYYSHPQAFDLAVMWYCVHMWIARCSESASSIQINAVCFIWLQPTPLIISKRVISLNLKVLSRTHQSFALLLCALVNMAFHTSGFSRSTLQIGDEEEYYKYVTGKNTIFFPVTYL